MSRITIALIILLGLCSVGFAQVTGDYRSQVSAPWTTASTWQIFNGTTWVTATVVRV